MPTFYDLFRSTAERWPQNVALEIQRRDAVESYTYGELRGMAESIARWLTEQNFGPAARIAILAENHPLWVAVYLGIIAAGHTTVPLDTALHADQAARLLADSDSSLLFCDGRHLSVAHEAAATRSIPMVRIDEGARPPAFPNDPRDGARSLPNGDTNTPSAAAGDVTNLDRIVAAGPGHFTPQPASENDLVSLLYTSGTTADPKGVMLTHANFMGEVEAVFGWVEIGPQDALLGVLPLFHVLSQMANLLLPLVKGSRVVYLETLNTTELLRALTERRITAFAVVPQFFYLIHERIFKEISRRGRLVQTMVAMLMAVTRFLRNLGWNPGKIFFPNIRRLFGDHMRYLVTGGSRFDPEIARSFYALGIDVLQAYGLTETCGGAFANRPENNVIGSVGPPLPGVEGKILDPQPVEGIPQPVGEVAIRGKIVMQGYWNRPDATAAALANGWLHTGDLGYFDEGGNLFITGRKKEVIILSNGKNIYPEEVEAHYLKSPYIKEMCVLGLERHPGDPASDRLHAVIVPNFDLLRQRRIVNTKEVIRFDIESLSSQLASTKRIASYEVWPSDTLPRTTTRKLKRFQIERRVRENQAQPSGDEAETSEEPRSAEESAWLEQPDVERALRVIGEAVGSRPSPIRPSNNLELDLGLDSMQRVELLVALEQELGGAVEESRLAEVYTVRELVDLVRASARSGVKAASVRFAGWQVVLAQPPEDPQALALAQRQPLAEGIWYLLTRMVAMSAYDRFHLRVNGLEKLPSKGPFLLCSNHQSFIDGTIMSSLLPWPVFQNLFFVGTSEIFGHGFLRTLARWLRIILVDPDANLIPAMRAGAFGLRHGRVLVLYPEGERSIDGTPKTFKKGAAILSIHLQVPIVPVAITGFHDAWPRGKSFQKFAPLWIRFGDAIHPPPDSQASEEAYERLTAELRSQVVTMWEQLEQLRKGRQLPRR
ncbi:MAG TPA: AMP-binding protein [Terriglobales bacterium]|nr:AMP-binding protein [Terriglobales bacterium]